ncbi:NAD(P)/FAD-dependent oxidoreductase [bacterium]|nr:NAD(P)/FAD-dependent oxidoreductase [bacterium]MBU4361265.1 NAD(P)/FAD-dependent oxidoreductase [bacterium]MCG2762299.1 NAD(P)/FAD-dependent oxidoreductase [Candidatus Atribacteria bacterium]
MEIVIVGAGPAGCYTAQLLKKYGFKTRIIEEHREVGKPVRCAGLVGRQVFENTLLPLSKNSIINQINGALFCYRDDDFQIKREGVAYVIDREKFDKNLSRGLEVECGKKLIEIKKEGSGYILKTDLEDIYADLVIGADGSSSQVRKFINTNKNNGKDDKKDKKRDRVKLYAGVQYRIKLDKDKELTSPSITQVHLREGIPFFIWIIPEGDNIIRLGVISKNCRKDLEQFIEDFRIKGEIIEKLAGIFLLGLTQNFYQNIALVGDAACQVKPLTGGGIYYGLKSAEILAECVREGKLGEYDKRLKKKFGREIKFGLKARKLYEEINEKELKNIFMLFKKNAGIIEKAANFENHSVIFMEILKNPKIFRDARQILSRNIGKLLF